MLNLEKMKIWLLEVSFCSKDCNINVKFAEPVKCVKNNIIQLNIVRTYKHVKPSKDRKIWLLVFLKLLFLKFLFLKF